MKKILVLVAVLGFVGMTLVWAGGTMPTGEPFSEAERKENTCRREHNNCLQSAWNEKSRCERAEEEQFLCGDSYREAQKWCDQVRDSCLKKALNG